MKKYNPIVAAFVWAMSFVAIVFTVATCSDAQAFNRGVYPSDTKFVSGTPSPGFGHGCPLESDWLAGTDLTVGVRDLDQFSVYLVSFPELVGKPLGFASIGGLIAHPLGQGGTPQKPRVSEVSANGPWRIAGNSTIQPVTDSNGNTMLGMWCGGGLYEIWRWSAIVLAPGATTDKVWLSGTNGAVSLVTIFGPAFNP